MNISACCRRAEGDAPYDGAAPTDTPFVGDGVLDVPHFGGSKRPPYAAKCTMYRSFVGDGVLDVPQIYGAMRASRPADYCGNIKFYRRGDLRSPVINEKKQKVSPLRSEARPKGYIP